MKRYIMVVALIEQLTSNQEDTQKPWVVESGWIQEDNCYYYVTKEIAFFDSQDDADRWIARINRAAEHGCHDKVEQVETVTFAEDFVNKVGDAKVKVMSLGAFEFGRRKAMRKKFVDELGFNFKSRAYVKWALSAI